MKEFILPTWDAVHELYIDEEKDREINAIEFFVYENEPAGEEAEAWRKELNAAIKELLEPLQMAADELLTVLSDDGDGGHSFEVDYAEPRCPICQAMKKLHKLLHE